MRTIERKQIDLALTEAHPQNREFPTTGKEWEEFEADVGARGIQEDLVVRWAADLDSGHYQVLRGHRRRHAGLRRKVKAVWALVVDASDEEAFEHMWEGNLFREDINPADEARAVRVMVEDFGRTVEELAAKWHRSVEWIRARQGLLELGDEVLEAVARPGRDRLTMGAVEQILKVPEEFRPEAVQLVLHPVMGTLCEDDAREVLQRCLLAPKAAEAAWEAARGKAVKAWRKDLEKLCLPQTRGDLMISSKGVAEAQVMLRGRAGGYAEAAGMLKGYVEAEARVPLALVMPDAPAPPCGLRWLHLAVKHGVAVVVVPGAEAGESRAVINERMVMDAEGAMAEHPSGGNWLVVGKQRVQREEEEQAGMPDARVAKAQADLEAGFDTGVDVGEKPETVISQHVERAVMIDLTPVRNVALWAVSADADPMNAPEWVPKWACKLGVEGLWGEIDAVTSWVMDLRK